ncbi:MAG: hypothetical protein U0U67_08030 [Chitinophagales bacterium]
MIYRQTVDRRRFDTLIYQICDGYPTPGDCDTIVYITINPMNDLPTG